MKVFKSSLVAIAATVSTSPSWLLMLLPQAQLADAMPATSESFDVRQPDGTFVTLFLKGDEMNHVETDTLGTL